MRFIYQYNQDPRRGEYENVPDDTAPPKVGDHIWRKIGSQNLEWVVEDVTTIRRATAAANVPEKFHTEYVIDLILA
jgi:hypothetical protein